MPWSHCGNEFLLDDEACETCGISKLEWTIQADKTRVLRIGGKQARPAQTTWVELALHDEDGVGVAGQAYVLLTPDGRRHEGVLDENGRARLEDVPPGKCQVTFPGRRSVRASRR